VEHRLWASDNRWYFASIHTALRHFNHLHSFILQAVFGLINLFTLWLCQVKPLPFSHEKRQQPRSSSVEMTRFWAITGEFLISTSLHTQSRTRFTITASCTSNDKTFQSLKLWTIQEHTNQPTRYFISFFCSCSNPRITLNLYLFCLALLATLSRKTSSMWIILRDYAECTVWWRQWNESFRPPTDVGYCFRWFFLFRWPMP
jgi:hypothetical protein